ncbi:MAG: DUF3127 domain-containing protein [Bacteroidetes bacterium]|nr:MAG: DUF3127 domain-containing protein [Bacteroidota bacterium]
MNIKGKILELKDTVQVTDTFKKREFIVEYADNPQYPEFIKFELIQDKCDLIDDLKVDQEVDVHFNLRGRKWTDPKGEVKYFNSLQAWRIDPVGSGPSQAANDPGSTQEPAWLNADDNSDDDLPF